MIKELLILAEVELLTGNGSQKEKQKKISENLSDEMLYILDVCFNPFVTTKLHKLELEKNRGLIPPSEFPGFAVFQSLIEDLKKAPAANDSLRQRANLLINSKISSDPKEDLILRDILMKILTKRMNIGIGAKLINKAVERELIPDPSIMLATDDQKEIEKWDQIYCEEKYDGVRVIAIVDENGDISFYTRAFNELDSSKLQNISNELKKAAGNLLGLGFFFDGELTDHNRKSVSGKVTQILKGTAPDNIDESFLFNVFDIVSSSVLETGKGSVLYSERRKLLSDVLGKLDEKSCVRLGHMWEVNSTEEILTIYNRIVKSGGEGVICKNDHVYECKRSKSWIKLKQIQDCDLEIIGWYPGEGKREGFIGGFMCTDLSKTLNVKIGSGFTDADLQSLSKDPDSMIGKIAAVQYNEPITDKHGNRSLFLPRFIEIRNDKDSPDDLSKLF